MCDELWISEYHPETKWEMKSGVQKTVHAKCATKAKIKSMLIAL